jgi:hypothetical protein
MMLFATALLAACGSDQTNPGMDSSPGDTRGADTVMPRPDVTTMADSGGMDSAMPGTDAATDTVAPRDVVARDVSVTPSPGQVFCFNSMSCSGGTPVCCDYSVRSDGGRTFTDICIAAGAMCGMTGNAGSTFACDDGPDCTGGQVCCAGVGMSSSGTPFLSGTTCAATCTGAMNQQLCSSDGDCGAGHTCVPMHVSGRDIGYCM